MKKLFVAVLMCSYIGISFGANSPSKASSKAPGKAAATSSKTAAKDSLKTLFATSENLAEGDKIRQKVGRTEMDTEQIQEIIDTLPASDQKVLNAVKTQIISWPPQVFEEISSYREFVINARKIAQQKYELLSQEAKSALESEKQLKSQLSAVTLQKLDKLETSVLY